MVKEHHYKTQVTWTGNTGQGTANYRAYERSYNIEMEGKPSILGSSDAAFRGDVAKYSPEDLLVASLSACHLLWYLHLCADASIVITQYCDHATGTMQETAEGGGCFTEVVLKPVVTITSDSNRDLAKQLHEQAHHSCFIANSMNFPVRCEPVVHIKETV